MKHAGCTTIITSPALIESSQAIAAGIEEPVRLYLTTAMPTEGEVNGHDKPKTIDDLFEQGRSVAPLPPIDWTPEVAQSSIAYLCATSGTSGTQVRDIAIIVAISY